MPPTDHAGTTDDDKIKKVISYWFGEGRDVWSDDYAHNGSIWWKGTAAVDKEIEALFGRYAFHTHTTLHPTH